MKPSQAREAAPGLTLETTNSPWIFGSLLHADGTGCTLKFWRAELEEIQCWKPEPGQDLADSRVPDLEDRFGTATSYVHGQRIDWQNESVNFSLVRDFIDHKGSVLYIVSDRLLGPETECDQPTSPNYREAPTIRSFF